MMRGSLHGSLRGSLRAAAARLVLLVLGAFVVVAPAATAALAPETPATAHKVVETTSVDMLELIEESRTYVDEDPERFYTAVENLLSPVIDFDGFARSVMARHYKQATPAQRSRFAETFRTALVRTYALALTEFKDGEVVVLQPDKAPTHPDRDQVKMEIRLSKAEIYPVHYAMERGKDGQWRVRNIVINGINIGLTYRNQFTSAVTDKRYGGDLDKVIDAWGNVIRNEAQASGAGR